MASGTTGVVGGTAVSSSPRYWSLAGVEMAQPLLRQTKITGAPSVAAKLRAAWKSPSEAAPSPK